MRDHEMTLDEYRRHLQRAENEAALRTFRIGCLRTLPEIEAAIIARAALEMARDESGAGR